MKQPAIDVSEKTQILAQLSQDVIYMMGMSFVIGSFFTILLLMLLDFMRRNKQG